MTISFEIDKREAKAAAIVKNRQLRVEHGTIDGGISPDSENLTAFIKQCVETYPADNAVFTIPVEINPNDIHILHDVVRQYVGGEIRFVDSPVAVVALYQYLTGVRLHGNSLVLDLGYETTRLSYINSDNLVVSRNMVYNETGTRLIDEKLLEYVNGKFNADAPGLSDMAAIRKNLYYAPTAVVASPDGRELGRIGRDTSENIYNETLGKRMSGIINEGIIGTMEEENAVAERIFLVGEGASIAKLTMNIITRLNASDMNDVMVIRGLKTNKGDFHSQTAALTGALYLALGECDRFDNVANSKKIEKQCVNPYCRALIPARCSVCPECGAEMDATEFFRCRNCGKVISASYSTRKNNFCCYCGKHQLEHITLKQ